MAKKKSTMMGFYPSPKLRQQILAIARIKQQTISVVVNNAVLTGISNVRLHAPPIMEIDERQDSP